MADTNSEQQEMNNSEKKEPPEKKGATPVASAQLPKAAPSAATPTPQTYGNVQQVAQQSLQKIPQQAPQKKVQQVPQQQQLQQKAVPQSSQQMVQQVPTFQQTVKQQQQQQIEKQQKQQKQQQQQQQGELAELQSRNSQSIFDEESIEVYDNGRYFRSTEQIGKGKFKLVFRGFDAKGGQDIAWSKINLNVQNLNLQEANDLLREMEKGLALDHPHIIKCHRCWLDKSNGEINLITERFTSGSLRHYRKMFEQVEMNVIRKYTRQLLKGLDYLHSKTPPIVHGDLRCDKIYVNGYSGELKIGDLGLAKLLPKRYANGEYPLDVAPSIDIKALGLCILELCTNVKLDLSHLYNGRGVKEYINQVKDLEANEFIQICFKEDFIRGNGVAAELLKHPFVQRKHGNGNQKNGGGTSSTPMGVGTGVSSGGGGGNGADKGGVTPPRPQNLKETGRVVSEGEELLTGDIRGEDYRFQFEGRKCDGNGNQIHFTIKMYVENDDVEEASSGQQKGRSLEFEFDPEIDTVDKVITEMQEQFGLSDTDANLCAAAMREWLAREFPDYQIWDMD